MDSRRFGGRAPRGPSLFLAAAIAAVAAGTGAADAATPPVKLVTRTLLVSANGHLQLRVFCRAASSQVCRGRLTLSWLVSRKRHTLARAQFTISGRTTGVVTVVLSSPQRRALRQARKLAGTTTIVARSGGSRNVSTTTQVVLRPKA